MPGNHPDRGMSESLQWAVLLPTIMLAVLGTIQAAVWLHGHNVARQAASAAAQAESAALAGSGSGARSAEQIAAAGGLTGVRVDVQRSVTTVRVDVTGQVALPIDLGLGRISQTATAPLERVS